jgi:hypothetical protein
LDGKPMGEIAANGALRTEVTPGRHEIELSKEDYGPVRFSAEFVPGQSTRPGREELAMARIAPPARPDVKPDVKQPDPRQVEDQDWEKVRASNSVDELDDFIRKHTGGAHTEGARARVAQLRQQIQLEAARQAEQNAWDSLDKTRKAALQDFTTRFSNGSHQQEARALIAELEKREADALSAARAAAAEQQKRDELKGSLADQQAIVRTLGQYESAYNAKNLKALQDVWRDMPKSVSDPLAAQFRYARGLAFQIKPTAAPVVNGNSATVTCTRSLDLTTTDGQKVNSGNERVRVTLEKTGQSWAIQSIATY